MDDAFLADASAALLCASGLAPAHALHCLHQDVCGSGVAISGAVVAGHANQPVAEVDHLLLAHMDAKTGKLLAADLVPPSMDLSHLVKQADGSLAVLVGSTRSLLDMHFLQQQGQK